jgi:hypothetical protein
MSGSAPFEMPKQIEVAYKDAVDNLMFLKRQQWLVTNYSLLAQGAILFASKEAGPNMQSLLVFFAIVACIVSLVVILLIQGSMTKFRQRLRSIYEVYFTERERETLWLRVGNPSFFTDPFILGAQLLICVASFGVSLALKW